MADPLPTVDVTGSEYNQFNELDLMFPGYFNPGFYGTSDPSVQATDPGSGGSEAFAPPLPELPLPEVIVQPKPIPAPPPVLIPSITTVIGSALTGLVALLFPQPTGPREFDEAPGGGGTAPPSVPPGAEDPIQPPNWWDLVNEPFPVSKPLPLPPIPVTKVPAPPVEMPPGEDYFDVSPPGVEYPSFPRLPDPFRFVPTVEPIEVPLGQPGVVVFPDLSPDTGPRSTPAPDRTPRGDPLPADPFVFPDVLGLPDARPSDPTAPDVFGSPLPDIVGDPFGDPVFTPGIPAPTRPDTRTPTGDPNSFVDLTPDFFAPPQLSDPLLTEFGPNPTRPDKDTCSCAKKPKKKKKSQERSVCYRGTYVQRTRGISYKRLEEVPCEAAPKNKPVSNRETDPFGRPTPKKKRKGKTQKWKDVLDDVFGRSFSPT